MTQPQPPNLQDAIRLRQQQAFVGRGAELEAFREQLALAWDDPRRRYVLNVYGQGGVGKTTLLRQFVRLARGQSAAVALTDDIETDAPAALARLAAQLGQGAANDPFYAFDKAYRTYRQKREELEADPDAPSGLAGLVGRAAVRVGAKVVRNAGLPGADLALSLVEDPLAEQAGQWAEFVRRKLGNRDEVQLVLEPEVVLTPLFVQGLNTVAAARPVAILCDTYERTAAFLDGRLRALLDGRHGNLPANLTLVIAGRHPLDGNAWADLEHIVAALCLEPFSEAEAREYLSRRGVTNEAIVAVILSLSGRLPLLLMFLAGQSPDDPARIGDATGTAIERFLKWVDDPARRALALNGALPRRLNRDVVGLLGGGAADFDWLVDNRLIERRANAAAWTYHEVVREQMLRYKQQESPAEWTALHERLAAHYAAERDGLGLAWSEGAGNERWRGAALEELYHRLCARPDRELAGAVNEFVAALDRQRALGREWAAVMEAAGRDRGHHELLAWGGALREGLKAYEDNNFEAAVALALRLLEWRHLELHKQAIVLAFRGYCFRFQDRYDKALIDYNRSIELNQDLAWAIAGRGETYRLLGRSDEALADYDRAIELDPNYAWAMASRGTTYLIRGEYDQGLLDLDRAIELDPTLAGAIGNRGTTYLIKGEYDKALIDLDRAIELDSTLDWAIGNRGVIYLRKGEYYQALADFNWVMEINPLVPGIFANRGVTYLALKRYKVALSDLNEAIELNFLDTWAIANRGKTYQLLKRYDEALADFDRAIELDPNYAFALASRGEIYHQEGEYDRALADLDRAIKLDPTDTWIVTRRDMVYWQKDEHDRVIEFERNDIVAIASRGERYRRTGWYDSALANFNRAIQLDPNYAWALANRGVTYLQKEEYDQALADLDRAIEINPKLAGALANRGAIYGRRGAYERALADVDRAIELDPTLAWAVANRGETYRRMSKYHQALADLDRAIELDPTLVGILTNRGVTCRLMGEYNKALADFNQELKVKPDFGWCLYQRAITHKALDPNAPWRDDLERAIALVEDIYRANPTNLHNLCNLALYYVAGSDAATAEALYREALAAGPAALTLRDALRDLDDYRHLFPTDPPAARLRGLLAGESSQAAD